MLDIFRVWRRHLPCLEGLILLVIAMTNVDGILYSSDLRRLYGGGAPIAPDHLRQPISSSAVAVMLGAPVQVVRSRVAALAEQDECRISPEGLLISEHQLEGVGRTAVVRGICELLYGSYARLGRLGLFEPAAVFAPQDAETPQMRSAAAYGAKFVMRTIEMFSQASGDVRDSLILLELLRRTSADWGASAEPKPGDAAPARMSDVAAALGLSPGEVRARVHRLIALGLVEKQGGGVVARPKWGRAGPWSEQALRRNVEHLFQLYSGMAAVGALAGFSLSDASTNRDDG